MTLTWRIGHIAGAIIIALTLVLTLCGATLAPHDPRERHTVLRVAEGYISPPFPIGTDGFWLGSDQYGRDLLSRLLAGTQPTMLTIAVATTLRLLIGSIVGVLLAFGGHWSRRCLQPLQTFTLTVPVLLSALFVLAVGGSSAGVGIFIVAMSWGGWGEVSQQVAHVGHTLKRQAVYEAAVSGGSTTMTIVMRHMLRLVAPLLPVIIVNELSTTLILLAALGFLGFYVGGTAWIIVAGDAVPVGARSADYAELGQLLATSYERMLHPEGLIVVGIYVGIITLGIQLVLDLLRQQSTQLPQARAHTWVDGLTFRVESGLIRASQWRVLPLVSTGAIVVGASLLIAYQQWPAPSASVTQPAPVIMNARQPWGHVHGDAAQSYRGQIPSGLPAAQLLTMAPEPLSGGGVVANDGSVVHYGERSLLIYTPAGTWQQIPVKYPFVGTPSLTSQGEIVTVGVQGLIRHYTLQGEIVREYGTASRAQATAGAVIMDDDTVIVTVVDRLEAFKDGALQWRTPAIANYAEYPAVLAPDGSLVFLGATAFDSSDGGRLPAFGVETGPQFENPTFVSGADGFVYHRVGHHLYALQVSQLQSTVIADLGWEANRVTLFYPDQSGVSVRGTAWHTYTGYGNQALLVWVPRVGDPHHVPIPADWRVMVSDDDARIIGCTPQRCSAYHIGEATPLWTYETNTTYGDILGISALPTGLLITHTHALIWVGEYPYHETFKER